MGKKSDFSWPIVQGRRVLHQLAQCRYLDGVRASTAHEAVAAGRAVRELHVRVAEGDALARQLVHAGRDGLGEAVHAKGGPPSGGGGEGGDGL